MKDKELRRKRAPPISSGQADARSTDPSPVQRLPRTKLMKPIGFGLVARSAGRCEFRGCNENLFEHPLTQDIGNFSENAHIVAFREGGPRGRDGERPADIDSIDNLMLLCARDHKLIDDNPRRFPRAELERHKEEHESRIRRVTSLGPEMQTTVLQVKARIGGNVVDIAQGEISAALRPMYPAGRATVLDLTGLGEERDGAFYTLAVDRIREETRRLYIAGSELEKSKRLSVFGLAPIPLLISLGSCLSNKVATDFFQCHRDRADRWTWHDSGTHAEYATAKRRVGSDANKVALVLSLSGPIDVSSLPAAIDSSFAVYELALESESPHPGFLRQREDLERFRTLYRSFLADLRGKGIKELHVFPAVPAPVAIVCGFDLLPKVDPSLVIYDNVKSEGGFVLRLKVNHNDW